MKSLFTILAWLGILVIAAHLRLDDLSTRPFHADEATGAKITSMRLESGTYVFDPLHYHGPTLSQLGALSARAAGESQWSGMTKQPLRMVTALAGCLLVMVPLIGRRRFGDLPMLLAALALATSPLLVYYSRMYIHEVLLGLFGVLALSQLVAKRCWWPAGLWIGLMFATKETFAISLIAWAAAGVGTYLSYRDRPPLAEALKALWKPLLIAGLLALAVSMAFYTNGFSRWSGAVDAFRTYFVYDTVDDHDKPFGYYLGLLLQPRQSGGLWWFETTVAVAAGVAVVASFLSKSLSPSTRAAIHFLALAAVFHVLIYSLISYKTPWLMLLPWAHVCLLAGFAVVLPMGRRWATAAITSLFVLAMIPQWLQARHATGRYASDDRNPYAYVPTAGDMETLDGWLDSIDQATPSTDLKPLVIIGSQYWPLPWYLRDQGLAGASTKVPAGIERVPVVFALEDLTEDLIESHVPVPRGLRTDTPMVVWIRNDFWDASVASDEP